MEDTLRNRERLRDEMIRHFEGNKLKAYVDSEGIPTIGTGATSYEDDSPVRLGDTITQDRSEKLLRFHLDRATNKLRDIEGYQMLTPNAQAAVDSFAFNAGPNFIEQDDNFGTLNRAIREGSAQGVADALPLYDNGNTPGLVRRRQAERDLALTAAMDPVDSTLANDLTRKFGTDAVQNGQPVKWGGQNYGWQSPESFNTIQPPPPPTAEQQPSLYNLFGILR